MYRAMNFQGAMPVPHLCLMPCSLQVPGCSFQSGHCAQRARPLAENRKASWNPSCSICALCDGTRDGSISSNLLPHVRPVFEKCFVVFLHISFISQRFLLRFSFLFLSENLSISVLLSHSPRWNIQSSWAIQEAKRLSEFRCSRHCVGIVFWLQTAFHTRGVRAASPPMLFSKVTSTSLAWAYLSRLLQINAEEPWSYIAMQPVWS